MHNENKRDNNLLYITPFTEDANWWIPLYMIPAYFPKRTTERRKDERNLKVQVQP